MCFLFLGGHHHQSEAFKKTEHTVVGRVLQGFALLRALRTSRTRAGGCGPSTRCRMGWYTCAKLVLIKQLKVAYDTLAADLCGAAKMS
jgi:hypothetical protein